MSHQSLVHYNNHIFQSGGYSSGASHDKVTCYSIETDSWRPAGHLKEQRLRHSSFALGDFIYAVGGYKCYSLVWKVKSMEAFNAAKFLKDGVG